MKLTPHPIPLSLSGRLLQVTVAISLPAAKGTPNRSAVFCVHPAGSPYSPNAGFQNGMRGGLYQQNRIFSHPGNFLSLPVERKLRLDKEVPLSPSLQNPAFAGGLSALLNPRPTTNPDLLINSIDRYLEQGFFSVQFFHTVIFREGHVYIHLVSGVSSDKLVFEIVNIAS